ncbi:MAG: type VI secretion system tip protein VgrG [Pyrinomonadaceae bacterium]|nr:type VI secretion system tip protein VgrG [Pyrinomonadaceae bacterium]
MATTQDDRLLKIETPLGKDFLLLGSFYGVEEISSLYQYEVALRHEENKEGHKPTDVDINSILGKDVTVTISQKDGVSRTFSGIVNSFSKRNRNARFSFYTATIVPKIWLLTQIRQSRIFQHKSVQEILEKVFEGYEVAFEIQGEFERRNYCVQYRESDFGFASRLMEEEGFYYYFEQKGGSHKMIVGNTPQSHQDNPGKSEITYNVEQMEQEDFVSYVHDLVVDFTLQTGKIANRDYNFQLNTNKLESTLPSLFKVGGNQDLESYDYPGGYARKYDGIDRGGGESPSDLKGVFPDKDRTVENAMQVLDSQFEVLSGSSNCCGFTGGHRFKLKKHPGKKLNRQYIVTAVVHHAEQSPSYISGDEVNNPYSNNFTCIPHGSGAPPFRPKKRTPKPVVRGSQTAVVVGPAGEEIFTDKYGRVKAQFHWDREGQENADSSCWMRVGTLWAGKQWGVIHIPRIGQEVIVDFIEGDPDRPIIVGSVYNPDTMPPYTLPDNKTQSGVKSRSSKGGSPENFNEFRFEDKKGEEEVYLHAEKDWTIMVENDKNQIVGHDETLHVKNDRTKTVDNDETSTIVHNRTETVGSGEDTEKITIKGFREEVVSKNETVTIGENMTHDVGGEKSTSVGKSETTSVANNKTDNIGDKLTVSATNEISESSKTIKISAGMELVLSGPGGQIKIDAGGVTITGVLVKIN